jgi:hypothetical protein
LHWLRATRAATKLLRRLATQPLLRHRLLLLRTLRLLLRALLLLRAMLVLRLLPLLRTLVLPLRTQLLLLRLLLRLRAQATKHSRDAHTEFASGGPCCETLLIWRSREMGSGQAKKPRTKVRGFFAIRLA